MVRVYIGHVVEVGLRSFFDAGSCLKVPSLLYLCFMGNTFGHLFRVTTFGESHGPAIGVVVDGCPSGIEIDLEDIQRELDRRKPGQSRLSSARKEGDEVELLSGVFGGRSTGTPIAMLIRNRDARTKDYDHLAKAYRPSHADFTYRMKYGHRDWRGGGRSSARETAARVAAGAVAKRFLSIRGISIRAWVSQVGDVVLQQSPDALDLTKVEETPVRCPDLTTAELMQQLILKMKKEGDTVGGVVSCKISGCPPGWGEPVFDRLQADLAKAMLSINAAKGFEYGSGFGAAAMRGSQHNDLFFTESGEGTENPIIKTRTNFSGGIQGGISNGMDIDFRVAFKPVATILRPQESVNERGEKIVLQGKGRHDPCVVPRAVPIVEAMAALVLADHGLRAASC